MLARCGRTVGIFELVASKQLYFHAAPASRAQKTYKAGLGLDALTVLRRSRALILTASIFSMAVGLPDAGFAQSAAADSADRSADRHKPSQKQSRRQPKPQPVQNVQADRAPVLVAPELQPQPQRPGAVEPARRIIGPCRARCRDAGDGPPRAAVSGVPAGPEAGLHEFQRADPVFGPLVPRNVPDGGTGLVTLPGNNGWTCAPGFLNEV